MGGVHCSRVVVGSDHGGFAYKNKVLEYLKQKYSALEIIDSGCYTTNRVDYPDIASACCAEVLQDNHSFGILIDGSGIGISVAANKVRGIRAAVCHDFWTASMCREHNDANVLCFGERNNGIDVVTGMVDCFLKTAFGGDRHVGRLEKIAAIEKQQSKKKRDVEAAAVEESAIPDKPKKKKKALDDEVEADGVAEEQPKKKKKKIAAEE